MTRTINTQGSMTKQDIAEPVARLSVSQVAIISRSIIQRLAPNNLSLDAVEKNVHDVATEIVDMPDETGRQTALRFASLHASQYLRHLRPTNAVVVAIDAALPNGEYADLVYEVPREDGPGTALMFDTIVIPDNRVVSHTDEIRRYLDDAEAAYNLAGADFGELRAVNLWYPHRCTSYFHNGSRIMGLPFHHTVVSALANGAEA